MISLILLRIIVTPVSLHIIVTYFWISVVLKTWFESTYITTCVYTGLITILLFSFFFFLRFYLLISRQRGREGERDRNIHVWLPLVCPLLGTWPATQACALTGNWTSDPWVCRLVLNPLIGARTPFSYSYSQFLFIDLRERKGHTERKINLLFHLFMHSLVDSCILTWPGIEPTTLAYWDNALTNWVNQPGPTFSIFNLTLYMLF